MDEEKNQKKSDEKLAKLKLKIHLCNPKTKRAY